MLFLSRNVVSAALVRRAHPSGTFIVKVGPVYLTKTWLSGMSPAAADSASPCNAPGETGVEIVRVG